ncbi:hypothetical protein OQA88_2610 [Cercophora sp. LCS_1]
MTVSVFKLDSDARAAPLFQTTMDSDRSTKSTGIALSGEYLTIWGTAEKGRRASLKVARIPSTPKAPSWFTIPLSELERFDVDKRVAVSRRGFVALIRFQKLVIIDLNLDPVGVFSRETPRNPQPFVDVAFNDTGDLLFAWATASPQELLASLFVHRMDDLEGGRIESVSYYACAFNSSFNNRLIPYNSYNGCIIAEYDQYYYPVVISAGSTSSSARKSKNCSEAIRRSVLKTSSMYNNHSLIAVQRSSAFITRDRLVEYPLMFEGTSHQFGEPVELARIGTRVESSSQIKVIRAGGDVCVFIFGLGGRYEMVRFSAQPSVLGPT